MWLDIQEQLRGAYGRLFVSIYTPHQTWSGALPPSRLGEKLDTLSAGWRRRPGKHQPAVYKFISLWLRLASLFRPDPSCDKMLIRLVPPLRSNSRPYLDLGRYGPTFASSARLMG